MDFKQGRIMRENERNVHIMRGRNFSKHKSCNKLSWEVVVLFYWFRDFRGISRF
jgi:hypothetical protein